MPLYADIVLPLAQPAYTFAVPEGMHVEAGQAVAVQAAFIHIWSRRRAALGGIRGAAGCFKKKKGGRAEGTVGTREGR